MSSDGNANRVPSRAEVEARFLDLITGRCDRHTVATWANELVARDVSVSDPGVWKALVALSGADLSTSDREFLHGEVDFCAWLEALKRSAP